MQYESYKGRSIDTSKPVYVYKNLHNGKLSVKQGHKVVAHVDNILLSNVEFIVRASGRKRVLEERKKNVHAFIKGHAVITNTERNTLGCKRVTYNPYKHDYFHYTGTDVQARLDHKDMLYCDSETGIFVV